MITRRTFTIYETFQFYKRFFIVENIKMFFTLRKKPFRFFEEPKWFFNGITEKIPF